MGCGFPAQGIRGACRTVGASPGETVQVLVLREEVLGAVSPNEREVLCVPHLLRSPLTFAGGKSPA